MKRLLPHPGLTVFLILLWLFLANSWTLNSLVLAAALGLLIPLLTRPWWPARPRVKRPLKFLTYIAIVLWDVTLGCFQVAWIILRTPRGGIQSNWVVIPLDLTSPEAITLLAGTITMTPGTITADWSVDGRTLLVHSLHAPDPALVRDGIKTRYERRLKEIFE